ncbi:putative F-box/FBD/LRR-repeat protein At4g13965 [Bidens hawaiensis]|uniref:putative F-box/FBD/LRR-repeat protein At4g13965 n=1 Tax=Bidens hawaiensis TaxID=980011 RepID=UPI00404A8528
MWWWSLFSFVKNICGFVEDDRLSSLSDDLLHKILSYVDTKDAIKTSGLSSRWRYIWTSMPYLNFNFDPSNTSKFVHDVLSHRDKLTGLHSLNLRCCPFDSAFAETVLSYALCNHVQELTLECLRITLPDSLIISRCLKHLTLLGSMSIRLETPWELPALTTLHLEYITFCNDKRVDLFSKCVNLKDLTLEYPRTSKGFRIWHPCLSSLTIKSGSPSHFKDDDDDGSLQFSVESLDSLEKFDLCILSPPLAAARKVFGLLQHLHRVKFLTLNLEVVEVGIRLNY